MGKLGDDEEGFISIYSSQEYEDSVTYFMHEHKYSAMHSLACSSEEPIDLNALINEEGIYSVMFYVHSADDTDNSPIIIYISFLNSTIVLQWYELNGEKVHRFYDRTTERFSEWTPYRNVIQTDEESVVKVTNDTMVLRKVEGDPEKSNRLRSLIVEYV